MAAMTMNMSLQVRESLDATARVRFIDGAGAAIMSAAHEGISVWGSLKPPKHGKIFVSDDDGGG